MVVLPRGDTWPWLMSTSLWACWWIRYQMLQFLVPPAGGRYVKKHSVSDLVLTAATIKTVKMLSYTVFTVLYICIQRCSLDGVGTSPGATMNKWKRKQKLSLKCCLLTWPRASENFDCWPEMGKQLFLFIIFKGCVWNKICSLVYNLKMKRNSKKLFSFD